MKKFIHITAMLMILAVFFQCVSLAAENSEDLLTKLNFLNSFYKEGKYNECIASADSLLKSDNTLMEAYKFKALSYFKQKEYKLALVVFKEQLSLNPNNEFALYNSACLQSLLGHELEAAECLKKVMELNVSNKRGIKTDSDFDNIKDNIIFKNINGISVIVGGRILFFDVPPEIINDRTMVPMRGVFEALGAKLEWDGNTNTVTAVKGNTTVVTSIDSNIISINGVQSEIDTAPVLKDGRTLVPVRFVSEAFGAEVKWNEKDEIVEVLTKAPNGNSNYDEVKEQLDKLIDISPIDGLLSEPYSLDVSEDKMLIIAKDKKALELFNSLSDELRAKYMYEKAAVIKDTELVQMEFILEGKAYYIGNYTKNNNAKLIYYENGTTVNAVMQDTQNYNYKDYYKEAK